jgi:hypothetical protein
MTNYGIYLEIMQRITICAILQSIQRWVGIKIMQITSLRFAYRQKMGKISDKPHRFFYSTRHLTKKTCNGESQDGKISDKPHQFFFTVRGILPKKQLVMVNHEMVCMDMIQYTLNILSHHKKLKVRILWIIFPPCQFFNKIILIMANHIIMII